MKQLDHNDLTSFEHACNLGNLSALKIAIINQSPDVNNPIYLNGLLLAIENQRTEIFRYLIGLDSYKIVLSRYYPQIKNQLKEHGPLFLLTELENKIHLHESVVDSIPSCYSVEQIPPFIFEKEEAVAQQLNDDDVTFINELSAYYESSLSGQTLESHLQALKNQLAKHYQAHPAIYEELSLPLDLETFKFTNRFVSEDIQNQMLETYYQHPIHTAWRFVASSQAWDLNIASSQKSFDICQHETSTLLILVWFAAKDNDFPYTEKRLAHFFHTLANINCESHPQRQISFELMLIEDIYPQIDNLQGDIPCTPSQLKKKLLSAIIEHPITSKLSLDKLYNQALNFITDHWVKLIQNLSLEQYLMLKYYLDKISIDPDIIPPPAFFDLYQLFSIDQDKFQCFSQLMNTHWGRRWSSQADFRRKAKKLLMDNICQQHSDAFKHTLNETFPQIQQSNIQLLSFFIPQDTGDDLSYANTDVSLFS